MLGARNQSARRDVSLASGLVRPRLMPPVNLPLSTYRLQLHAAFTFDDAARIVDYLAALGISHAYTSSYFMAVPGSTHGYDVVDPTRLNPEIGDAQAYERWIERLRAHGMAHIIDLVPNHMGIARSANPWWQDVLENGESSRYADVFDIDWNPLKQELEHRVLLPLLGDTYGAVLERQEIVLEYVEGAFQVKYFDHVLPIAPGTYGRILSLASPALLEAVGETSEAGMEFLSILTAIRNLPGRYGVPQEARVERDREKEVIKRRLAALTSASPQVLAHLERAVATLNGIPNQPESFDGLDELLSIQAYRVAFWRVAAEEINYRRFFDINELAAIRMEYPSVFDRHHAFAFELLERGVVDGLRIDHVDGLYDPARYLTRLRTRAQEIRPDLFTDEQPLYIVVEKILGEGEPLPDWPIAGTTGYDYLVMQNGLFVDGRNERALNSVYEAFTRLREPFREIVYRSKQLILRVSMSSELNVLAHQLNTLSEENRHYRDFTLGSLRQAMREIIACFPVYRTYVRGDTPVSERDRSYIEHAVTEAKRRNPSWPGAVYDFVGDLLLRRASYLVRPEDTADYTRFIGKFQQVTSPVTAKGIEDTALYNYNRLVSLNEVGGEPDHFARSPERVHGWMEERARRWPHGLSTTSTHDTKRSEDVRARLNALSEIPGAWKQASARWARANRKARSIVDGESYPSRNEEYLYYQTLLGSWPFQMTAEEEPVYTERIAAYMIKAMREAKAHSNWLTPSERHEAAMTRFVQLTLAPDNTAFRDDFVEFEGRLALFGIYNSLAQVVLKIGAPGVPDFYQGSELWDLSLVDPDNRRPVDYERRRALLTGIDAAVDASGRRPLVAEMLASPADDRLKLYTVTSLLRCRRDHRALFDHGDYRPLRTDGLRRGHLFAFSRTDGSGRLIVAVPRLMATLDPEGHPPIGERIWGDTTLFLPDSGVTYRHVLTGERVAAVDGRGALHLRAADLFADFPAAVLVAE
jgi:(1->4)-alpha-D-glucan 1-alpha-D-glucosylmutase